MSYDHPYSGEDSNFIRKHWNGDYSLGQSYWGNTVLVSVVTALLAFFALSLFNERSEARYSSIAVLSVTALSVAIWIWSARGTWASASKHVSRGGKAFWAGAARVAVVLGALRFVADLSTQAPYLAEHFRVALDDQLGRETKVQLRADGRSLLVSGGINDDTAQKLQQALNRAPRVRTIVLSSEGGWVGQGLAVADVISSRKLATYVEDECTSACTIAFLAGQDRAANPKARIGFHSFRLVGAADAASASAMVQKVYRDAGLSEDFINRVLQTPSEKVWYPTTAELLHNGVLTRQSFGGETAAMATTLKTRRQLESELLKNPVFAALAERYPAEFRGVVDAAWTSAKEGRTDAEVSTAARARVMELEEKLLAVASDDALIRYYVLTSEEVDALSKSNSEACAEMMKSSGKPMELSQLLPDELVQRELAIEAEVIRTSHRENSPTTSKLGYQKRLASIMKSLSPRQLRIIGGRPSASPKETCNAFSAFFHAINSIPINQRAGFLRGLSAS